MPPQPKQTRLAGPRKRRGAYYTPEAVAALLARWAVRSTNDRVLDPACGDGRFLTYASHSVGVEQDGNAAAQAQSRAPTARVCHDEFFGWARRERAAGSRFDCAMGNPPFIRYQTWSGGVRRRASSLCMELGVAFSGLSASWAPFLVAATGLLRPGGRVAFVVPAAVGHARYAEPLVEYLVSHFADVRIVAVRRKLFPRLSEDCWLLFADGFGGATDVIDLAAVDALRPQDDAPPAATVRVPVSEWRTVWERRLRPYLLGASARLIYQAAATMADSGVRARADGGDSDNGRGEEGATRRAPARSAVRLGALATVDLGYVSGANSFFHLTPSDAVEAGIPERFLQTTVPSARILPPRELTTDMVGSWHRNDETMFLLRIPSNGARLPAAAALLGQRCRPARPARLQVPPPHPLVRCAGCARTGLLLELHGRPHAEAGEERRQRIVRKRPARRNPAPQRPRRRFAARLEYPFGTAQLRTRGPCIGRRHAETGAARGHSRNRAKRSTGETRAAAGYRGGRGNAAVLEALW